ncbi:MAG TPA: hypothetical protein VN940_04930 [Candidatus Dormibacteraeota bacterium]|nr:hypothetical protein [Candidatus Dormibacteraeota bacterium]
MTDRRVGFFLLLAIVLAALALGLALAWNSYQHSVATPVAVAVTTPTAAACRSINGLPDPTCTPGVADPRVTQGNIRSTICVTGYTTTVRPPSSYTDNLKRQQITAYGYSDSRLADYEEDHLIPLELGGSPTDPKNLWPEPRSGDFPASRKDGVENSLHARVCAGLTTLAAAQAAIATNWESA